MKKINLLVSALSLTSALSIVAPIATSCSCSDQNKAITTDMLNIVGYTLKGFKSDLDLSKLEDYRTFNIPEGVKFIDEAAFKWTFQVGDDAGYINTISFPKSVREVRKEAFKTSTSIRVLDFSTWTVDEIYYATFEEDSFAEFGACGKVITNDDLTKEARQTLYDKLFAAGLNKTWFAEEKTNKVSADKTWMTQTAPKGEATYLFKLNDKLPAGTKMYANITRTGGTKGVACDDNLNDEGTFLEIPYDENGLMELPVILMNHKNKGDYATFTASFTAMRKVDENEYEPMWTETLDGFKLICGTNLPTSIKASVDKAEIKVGQTAQVSTVVGPEQADNKEVFYSTDTDVVEVDSSTGVVTAKKAGTAIVRATALGATARQSLSDTVEITVKSDTIEVEADQLFVYYSSESSDSKALTTNKINFQPNTKYVINFDLKKYDQEDDKTNTGIMFFDEAKQPVGQHIKNIDDYINTNSAKLFVDNVEYQKSTDTWEIVSYYGVANVVMINDKMYELKGGPITKNSVIRFEFETNSNPSPACISNMGD